MNRTDSNAEALAEDSNRYAGTCRLDGGSTRPPSVYGSAIEIRQRKSGCGRFGQHVELDRRSLVGWRRVEDPRRKVANEVFAMDAWEASSNANDQRCLQDTETEQIRQARPFAGAIEVKFVTRVLAMRVVERAVRVPLVVERPDTRWLEASTETELPAKRGLDVVGEGSSRSTIVRELCMKMIVCGTEGQEASRLALGKHDASKDSKGGRRGCDRAIVRKPERDVESDRLA